MPIWIAIILILIPAGLAIWQWRRAVTLQESLDSFVTYNQQIVKDLQDQVAAMPEKLEQVRRQAVIDYLAANPPAEGPITIDGVTYDSLVAFMQTITDQSKVIIANTVLIGGQIDEAAQPGGAVPPLPPLTPPDAAPSAKA